MKHILVTSILLLLNLMLFAAAPVVSNVIVTSTPTNVTINYNLSADAACKISILVSADNGLNYNIIPTTLSGDIGDQIAPGLNKQIVWIPLDDNMIEGTNYKIKIIARDNPIQNDEQFTSFLKVEGGTFSRQEWDGSYPSPPVMVTLSSFYIDKYEITQNEYIAVMGVNPSCFPGNPNRPVEQVYWFNAIEYCNLRSMQEGLTPAYSYSSFGTNPDSWPTGWDQWVNDYPYSNHELVSCNWGANGYRLPTEMEWMFAAKGGNQSQGYTYSGSNTIGNVAWYSSNAGYGLPGGSSHPDYGTHSVGTKDPNELGTFDMSGNVWELCWDICDSYPSGNQTNPTGPVSGSYRVLRGGGWCNGAYNCTVSNRGYVGASDIFCNVGFRCVRVFP